MVHHWNLLASIFLWDDDIGFPLLRGVDNDNVDKYSHANIHIIKLLYTLD